MSRVLIFGTSYIPDAKALWVVKQWVQLARTLSPEADLLIVDSASPVPPPDGVEVLQLGDNIGHLARGGQDGWGRAFCAGLGRAKDYDWVVHIETDLLFVRPVQTMIDRLRQHSLRVTAPWAMPYLHIETALMFMNGGWLWASALAERYDWRTPSAQPEARVEAIVGDDLWLAPLRGCRDDAGNADLKGNMFPGGCDYLTHADIAKYRLLLAMNGIEEAR